MTDDMIGITERADPTVNLNWLPWVESGKPAILITKSPSRLLPMLSAGNNIIIHCTITGLGGTPIEPSIYDPSVEVQAYHDLCRVFGSHRVILRIDPIIPWLISAAEYVRLASESEGRVRISFLDMYPHARSRFSGAGIDTSAQSSFHALLSVRQDYYNDLGEPEVCAEPGLPSVPCVGVEDCVVLGVSPKDNLRGQRPLCGCLGNKTELCNTLPRCSYGCLYCYWK